MQQAFYQETAKPFREGTYSITPRIQQNGTEVYWRIRAMSQLEHKEIWRRSQEQPKRYETMILAVSVCFPDLKQADLQDHYGAIGRICRIARSSGGHQPIGGGRCIDFI